MTSETAALLQRLDQLTTMVGSLSQRLEQHTAAVCTLAQNQGTRLNGPAMCARLGISRNTLAKRAKGKGFPVQGPDGKWALSDVIDWEQKNARH